MDVQIEKTEDGKPDDIRPEIVEVMSGGGVIPMEQYQDALESADEIIDLVLSWHEQESGSEQQ